MKKYILTGADGNLGSHLREIPGIDLITINRNNWNSLETLREGEITGVIHCAYDLKRDLLDSTSEVLDSNITSTGRLLDFCRRKKVKKFIFPSSCSVYGDSTKSNEDRQSTPITMNGIIKFFNEELIRNYCTHHNINYTIFRIFNSYGGRDQFSVVQKMISCAKDKKTFILVNGGLDERDFIHIRDVAQIIANLMDRDELNNQILNIGTGESTRIIDILKAVEKKFGPVQIIEKTSENQTFYSRANTTKLRKFVKFAPISVFEYIESL